ncbi:MAG TPA: hypothetical protein VGD40_05870 [Chryseosolibacter sp.]
MKTMLVAMVLSIFCQHTTHAWQVDSTQHDSTGRGSKQRFIRRVSTRIHSIGFFNFSGRICSNTPAIDFNLMGERNGYGVSVFAAKDLTDNYSANNFTFAILHKRFAVSNRITLTPSFGAVIDGLTHPPGDRVFLVSAFKASSRLTIDETALFANLLQRGEVKEWVNRIRFIYSQTNHIQFILSSWHNNAVLDNSEYVSGSFQAGYNRIALADHLYLQTAVSFFVMAKNSDEVPLREKNGLLLTIGLSVE